VRASNDTTRARLPLCSGLATSRCTSTRVPAGSNCAGPAAARGGSESVRWSAAWCGWLPSSAACSRQRVGVPVGRPEYALERCTELLLASAACSICSAGPGPRHICLGLRGMYELGCSHSSACSDARPRARAFAPHALELKTERANQGKRPYIVLCPPQFLMR
jgi:hypothetical protein